MFWVQVRPEVSLGMWISTHQIYKKKREEEAWRTEERWRQFCSQLTGRKLGDWENGTPSLLDLLIHSLISIFRGKEWYVGRASEEIPHLRGLPEKYCETLSLWWDRAMSRRNWETHEQSMHAGMWCHRHVMAWDVWCHGIYPGSHGTFWSLERDKKRICRPWGKRSRGDTIAEKELLSEVMHPRWKYSSLHPCGLRI